MQDAGTRVCATVNCHLCASVCVSISESLFLMSVHGKMILHTHIHIYIFFFFFLREIIHKSK